jgi:WD40 repeat protein
LLRGHTSFVLCCAWSPDGRTIASGSADATIKLWDAATGNCCATLKVSSNCLYAVAWSPNGRTLASSGDDPQTLVLWDVRE